MEIEAFMDMLDKELDKYNPTRYIGLSLSTEQAERLLINLRRNQEKIAALQWNPNEKPRYFYG